MTMFRTRKISPLLPVLALCAVLAYAAAASALVEPSVLEAAGIFAGIDESLDPHEITLNVNSEPVSGPMTPDCAFFDATGKEIKQDDFVELYLNKYVTLELYEHSGEVFACKGIR